MPDRRRFERYPVAWQVRLWLTDDGDIMTRAVDASAYGLRLALPHDLASLLLQGGVSYRVEVFLPAMEGTFVRVGRVRHVGEEGVGLQTIAPLPIHRLVPLRPGPERP